MKHNQEAQNAVEYGLLIATVVLLVLLAGTLWGQQMLDWFMVLVGHIATTNTR